MPRDRKAIGIIRILTIISLTTFAVIIMAGIASASVPGAYITGYVLDEDGKPVPYANVSVWQDGKLWPRSDYILNNCQNPQMSNIAYSANYGFSGEGGFLFGFLYPGDYVLKAEKDGYTGTANLSINAGTTSSVGPPREYAFPRNITLKGYHVPGLTAEQLAHTGAITGNIRTAWGFKTTGVNLSLWQDGRLVDRPDNPQASYPRKYSGVEVDYIFEHLAPGDYTVSANYSAGGDYVDSATITVGERTMRADIVLSLALHRPTDFPVNSFSPTVGEFIPDTRSPSSGVKASTGISWLAVLIVMCALAYAMRKSK